MGRSLAIVFRFVHKLNLSLFEIRISLKEEKGNSRENPLQMKELREGTRSSWDQVKMKLQGTHQEQDGLSAQSVPRSGGTAGGTPLAPSPRFITPFPRGTVNEKLADG